MNASKKEMVRDMFNSIAPTYDRLNHLLSFNLDKGWRRRTVSMVAAASPRKILDIAAGTGDLSIAIALKLPMAEITGIDLSENMLAVGKDKVSAAKLSGRVTLIHGDAEMLPFADESFDAVTIGFGIRNFGDINKGLTEAARVLRKGGKIFILEFSTPQGKIFGELYKLYFHKVLPVAGRIFSKDLAAYKYLPDSVDNFPNYLLFLQRIRESRFSECTARRLMRGVAYIYEGVKQ